MDFDFTDEQLQLRDTVSRFVQDRYGFERRRQILATPPGWSREVWQGLAELGLTAMGVPESHGGLGLGPVETMLTLQAAGPALLAEPLLSSAVLATAVLRDFGDTRSQDALLPALAAGQTIAVLAHAEAAARGEPLYCATRAIREGDAWVLDGYKAVVAHAPAADELLISARHAGHAGEAVGVSLFRVPRDMPGLNLVAYPTLDGQPAADVHLAGVRIPDARRVGAEGQALPAIERAWHIGLAALCAEAVGVMEAVVKATTDYLQTRQQFGQALGRFQALQHRMADMLIHLEQARSMSLLAAMRCTQVDDTRRRKALSAAKVVIGQASRYIGQQAVQLHGGMGMTDELVVSHWFKRLLAIELGFGDTDAHLQRFTELSRQG